MIGVSVEMRERLSLSAIDLIETLKDLLVRNQKKPKSLIALCSMEHY